MAVARCARSSGHRGPLPKSSACGYIPANWPSARLARRCFGRTGTGSNLARRSTSTVTSSSFSNCCRNSSSAASSCLSLSAFGSLRSTVKVAREGMTLIALGSKLIVPTVANRRAIRCLCPIAQERDHPGGSQPRVSPHRDRCCPGEIGITVITILTRKCLAGSQQRRSRYLRARVSGPCSIWSSTYGTGFKKPGSSVGIPNLG